MTYLTRSSLVPALLVAVLTLGAGTASAQSVEVLIQEGLDLRRQSRDQEALQRFQRAYDMSQSAQALAQIALAEQALGNFVQAEIHLSTAIQVRNDPWIAQRSGQLQQALATIQARLGTVELTGGVNGAEVWVDGENRGTFPQAARLRVRAGTVNVEIRANGYLPVQRQIIISAGGTAREAIQLVAANQGGARVQAQGGGGAVYQQPGTQTIQTEPNWPLFGIGLAVWGGPWIITWATVLGLGGFEDEITYSFIPVLGPWLLLGLTSVSEIGDEISTLLVLDGILQPVGIALAIIGLVSQREVLVGRLGDDEYAPSIALRPWTPPGGGNGVALQLTHF